MLNLFDSVKIKNEYTFHKLALFYEMNDTFLIVWNGVIRIDHIPSYHLARLCINSFGNDHALGCQREYFFTILYKNLTDEEMKATLK